MAFTCGYYAARATSMVTKKIDKDSENNIAVGIPSVLITITRTIVKGHSLYSRKLSKSAWVFVYLPKKTRLYICHRNFN